MEALLLRLQNVAYNCKQTPKALARSGFQRTERITQTFAVASSTAGIQVSSFPKPQRGKGEGTLETLQSLDSSPQTGCYMPQSHKNLAKYGGIS